MDRRNNPYAPAAGLQPPELAGRDRLIEDVTIDMDRVLARRPTKGLVLFGLARGQQNRAAQSIARIRGRQGIRDGQDRDSRQGARSRTCWRRSCVASSTPSTCAKHVDWISPKITCRYALNAISRITCVAPCNPDYSVELSPFSRRPRSLRLLICSPLHNQPPYATLGLVATSISR